MTDGNVAFKCTFNDGGAERGYVGFDGTCSDGNIIRNIRANRTWCSSTTCPCRKFYDRDLHGERPEYPCYESTLFETLTFGAGIYQRGLRTGQIIPMKGAQEGKVALLTTRLPSADHESERRVFGFVKIAKLPEDDDQGNTVVGDPDWSLRLSQEAAPLFWRVRPGTPDWRTGLFRLVSDQEVCDLLRATLPLLRSPHDRVVAEHLVGVCGSLPAKKRLRIIRPELEAVELQRKYGPGGEGDRHRELKKLVHRCPELLGLGPAASAVMEFRFRTGDRVDVAVRYPDDSWAVVEVEVEGVEGTLNGAHQALKYRALLSGHLDRRGGVRGVLVAYSIPEEVRQFCRRHGIRSVEIDPAEPND